MLCGTVSTPCWAYLLDFLMQMIAEPERKFHDYIEATQHLLGSFRVLGVCGLPRVACRDDD